MPRTQIGLQRQNNMNAKNMAMLAVVVVIALVVYNKFVAGKF